MANWKEPKSDYKAEDPVTLERDIVQGRKESKKRNNDNDFLYRFRGRIAAMLQVVKGDVFEFGLSFGNVDPELIEKVVFACKELGIEEEEDEFRVRIPGEVTKDFKTGFLKYDIIATLIDEQEVTLVHRQKIEVLERVENGG